MIKIDKNIPIKKQTKKCQYPLDKMEVGDSFFIEDLKTRNSVACAITKYRHINDHMFTTRKEGEGFRVWRIK